VFSFLKSSSLPKTIELESQQVHVLISKRLKTIALKHRHGQFFLEVPQGLSYAHFESILERNHSWLRSQVLKQLHFLKSDFKGYPGEVFLFLGETFHCVWLESLPGQKTFYADDQLDCENRVLRIRFKNGLSDVKKAEMTRKALKALMKQAASDYLNVKTEQVANLMGLQYQSVTIKTYKARWGSCYSDGRIQFNWKLMQAPDWIVDYVVVHEVAHLANPNHSKQFWQRVEAFYPLTFKAKQVLKEKGVKWIQFLS
jgi:predicted metal-dependent hydrolase